MSLRQVTCCIEMIIEMVYASVDVFDVEYDTMDISQILDHIGDMTTKRAVAFSLSHYPAFCH